MVLIDDSIVRGTTCAPDRRAAAEGRGQGGPHAGLRAALCGRLLLRHGHRRPASNLIANNHSVEEIAKIIGVDSLGYLSLRGRGEAGGQYPVRLLHRLLRRRTTPPTVPQDGGKDRFECKISERERT